MASSRIETVKFDLNANVGWRAFPSREGGWVSVCDSLGLTVGGDTWHEIVEASTEAVQLLLADLWKDGELGSFLTNHGWAPVTPIPSRKSQKSVRFDIPVTVQRDTLATHGQARAG